MDFNAFREVVRRRVCFSFADVREMVGIKPASLRVQLSRWCEEGQLTRLRKGLYALAPKHRLLPLRAPVVANLLVQPSYITGLWALEHHGLISPHGDEEEGHWRGEPAGIYTCAGIPRTRDYENELGRFRYYKLKPELLFGAQKTRVGRDWVWMATPEKALLDYFFVTPHDWRVRRILERGFQRLNSLDLEMLRFMAVRYRSPRLAEIVGRWRMLARRERLFAARWMTPPQPAHSDGGIQAAEAAGGRDSTRADTRFDVAHVLGKMAKEPVWPASKPAAPAFALDQLSSEEFFIGGEAQLLLGRPIANTIEGNWGRKSAKRHHSWHMLSDEPFVKEYQLPVWFTQRLWFHRLLKWEDMQRCRRLRLRPRWHRMKEWSRETKRRHREDPEWFPAHDDFKQFGLEYLFFPD